MLEKVRRHRSKVHRKIRPASCASVYSFVHETNDPIFWNSSPSLVLKHRRPHLALGEPVRRTKVVSPETEDLFLVISLKLKTTVADWSQRN